MQTSETSWKSFLESTPALTLARTSLPDGEFLKFLRDITRQKKPVGFAETLAWHAFEEIGWPEGKGYYAQHGDAYILRLIRKDQARAEISKRLALRQEKWRTDKGEHLAAHQLLISLLPRALQDAHLLGELAGA